MRQGFGTRLAGLAALAFALAAGGARAEIAVDVLPRADAQAADASAVARGALDARFVPLPRAHYIPAADESEVWLRITLDAPPPGTARVLAIARNPLERLTLYRRGSAHALWQEGFYGRAPALYRATAFTWPLPDAARAGDVYYLHSHDPDPSQLRVEVDDAAVADRAEQRFLVLLTAILAVLATMAITNFVFWVALRDRTYAHYVGYVLCVIAFVAFSHGLPYQVPWLEWTSARGSALNIAAGAATGLFATTFFRAFLSTRRGPRVFDRVLRAFLVLFALQVAWVLLLPLPLVWPMRRWANLGLLALSGVQILVALVAAWRGSRAARFFLVAWAAPIAATVLRALGAAGIIATTPAIVDGYLVGQALQALILSIGLADRTIQMRRERDRAEGLQRRAESQLIEERSRRSELELRASTDALTGVRNRGSVEALLAAAIANARRDGSALSLLFVDVDHFKAINDGHGHSAGDLCLVIVARRIQQELRERDVCGRFGGDEFVVLLPGSGSDDAQRVAARIVARVAGEPVILSGQPVPPSVTIGGATLVAGDDVAALLARADDALYRTKRGGRGRAGW